MGIAAGRYSGSWKMVSCPKTEGISDGPTSLHVKEGSSIWWSLVQVRNPPSAVVAMRLRTSDGTRIDLPWASEAENFFSIPPAVLQDTAASSDLVVSYALDPEDSLRVSHASLGREGSNLPFP